MPVPAEITRTRVANELAMLRREIPYAEIRDEKLKDFPLQFTVRLTGVPGPVWKEGQVVDVNEHELLIAITPGYPEQKPVVRWRTPIFHPNIMSPTDGGYVCTALIDHWTFRSTLTVFLKAVEHLLRAPNPDSPYDTDTCTRAAAWFRKNPYRPTTEPAADEKPRVRGAVR